MIRIENDIFYMSAGEACYIFKIANGAPVHVYFGKRVEPEDDLAALGFGADGVGEIKGLAVLPDGKQTELNFVYESAQVCEQKTECGRALIGGKTLCVTLVDKKAELRALLYYTPYARGGFARRAVIQNIGAKTVNITSLRQTVMCDGDCEKVGGFPTSAAEMGYFAAVGKKGYGDNSGEVYGFLCPFADGNIDVGQNPTAANCSCKDLSVPAGGEAACPEMLCVYSDTGRGGMSRVFHDILRENLNDTGVLERSPAVLFLARSNGVSAAQAIKDAYEMGFVVVALDGGEYSSDEIELYASACKESDIALGLYIRPSQVKKESALFGAACKKGKSSEYKYDFSDECIDGLIERATAVIEQNDIRYVAVDVPETDTQKAARTLYRLKYSLVSRQSELRVDYAIRSEGLRQALSVFYPVGNFRCIISPDPPENFKQRFDHATLGTLGYELTLPVSDGIKRAVRAQKLSYQDDALTVLRGDIYRATDGDQTICTAVTKDKSRAYTVCDAAGKKRLCLVGLDEHNLYHVHEMNITLSGAALMYCGIALDASGTVVLHLRQVADYFG